MTTHRLLYEDEHAQLREEARRWLSEHCDANEIRRLAKDARGDAPSLWRELAEMGWCGLLIAEEHGGAGLGAVHLAVLMEECGRRLLASPLLPTLVAATVLEAAGTEQQRQRWLPGIAAGEQLASLAHVNESGGWQPGDTTVTLAADGRLDGCLCHVWGGAVSDLVVVPVKAAEGLRFAVLTRENFEAEPEIGLDPSRRQARIRVRGSIGTDALLPADAEAVWKQVLPTLLTALAAEMSGGADALLQMTAEYVATREQFGKSIGAFQAIKHPLVDVLVGVEQLRSLVYAAATAIDTGEDDALLLARYAKAQASDVYPFAASRAIQFHGGYGFTEDCDAHLYLRRAQCSRPALGDARHQRAHIADELLGSVSTA
jgi:alkylation response protein AidB-like acyl-CoA dehydrogenase